MKKGFTLIELLVVISILGVLATLVLVSFTGTQKQARDTQRKSDIKQYQNALENYANRNNSLFPGRSGGVAAAVTLCTDLALSGCPVDPRQSQGSGYTYMYRSDGASDGTATATEYVLWAKLENPSTTTWWVVCSSGKVGQATTGIPPSSGNCPI